MDAERTLPKQFLISVTFLKGGPWGGLVVVPAWGGMELFGREE